MLLQLAPRVPLLLQHRTADRITRAARRRTTIGPTTHRIILALHRLRVLRAVLLLRLRGSRRARVVGRWTAGRRHTRRSNLHRTALHRATTTTHHHNGRRARLPVARRLRRRCVRRRASRCARTSASRLLSRRPVARRRCPTRHSRRTHIGTIHLPVESTLRSTHLRRRRQLRDVSRIRHLNIERDLRPVRHVTRLAARGTSSTTTRVSRHRIRVRIRHRHAARIVLTPLDADVIRRTSLRRCGRVTRALVLVQQRRASTVRRRRRIRLTGAIGLFRVARNATASQNSRPKLAQRPTVRTLHLADTTLPIGSHHHTCVRRTGRRATTRHKPREVAGTRRIGRIAQRP
ncbi:hypothetical protein R77591_00356 [Ralstonia mannitolilytica]|uniref:Uncharacterized protein n=1 Tax=Ralstonia mannitolilytica TaxID=105219 RepID=A0AAD2AM30_9RALS|nr:hypothetical protein R77591_00356 [Ralstonia mannitolilytica]